MLLVSLVASAAISALGNIINAQLPFGTIVLGMINAIVSFVLISVMFAAIYKVLPDRTLEWRDVGIGAVMTAALFTLGKSLIGWYIGTSAIAFHMGLPVACSLSCCGFTTHRKFFSSVPNSPAPIPFDMAVGPIWMRWLTVLCL